MNIPAAVISAGIGAALFAAMNAFPQRPSLGAFENALDTVLPTKNAKARTAVGQLLIDPSSADFGEMRSVQADAADYVCGSVKARDRSGRYSGHRAFVYTVATGIARIDDDGTIAYRHSAYRQCPQSDDERLRDKPVVPAIASVAKHLQASLPVDPSTLSAMASDLSAAGARSSGGTLEQQIGQMATQLSGGASAATARPGTGPVLAMAAREGARRSDPPPVAWPTFAADHPLAKPARQRTTAQAMALAADVEARWERAGAGASASRPSPEEIREACRALLSIDPKDEAYPKARAAFERLQRMDRDPG